MARQKGRGEYCSWSLIYASDIRRRKFPRSTFATLAISALREIICPRQNTCPVFFLKEHIFARGNSPSEIAKALNTDASLLRRGSSIRYINPLCEKYRRHKVEWIDQAENLCQMYVDFSYILVVFSYIDGFLGFG